MNRPDHGLCRRVSGVFVPRRNWPKKRFKKRKGKNKKQITGGSTLPPVILTTKGDRTSLAGS